MRCGVPTRGALGECLQPRPCSKHGTTSDGGVDLSPAARGVDMAAYVAGREAVGVGGSVTRREWATGERFRAPQAPPSEARAQRPAVVGDVVRVSRDGRDELPPGSKRGRWIVVSVAIEAGREAYVLKGEFPRGGQILARREHFRVLRPGTKGAAGFRSIPGMSPNPRGRESGS